jgi:hypothetical protein
MNHEPDDQLPADGTTFGGIHVESEPAKVWRGLAAIIAK